MSGPPHPKPVRRRRKPVRVVNPAAGKAILLRWDECACCGRWPASAHHVLPRGRPYLGDDVEENQLAVCGHGTHGCHGAAHGNPYTDVDGKRWEPDEVRRRMGVFIRDHRPDVIRYVLEKLGMTAGLDFLERRYSLVLEPETAPA